MSEVDLHRIDITTDSSGDFTINTVDIFGAVLQYRYVPDGTSPLATGADLTIAGGTTGIVVASQTNIGTSAFTKAPRQATHATDGTASLYAAAGEPVEDCIWVAGEHLTVTIAQGGDTKSGTLWIWTGEC